MFTVLGDNWDPTGTPGYTTTWIDILEVMPEPEALLASMLLPIVAQAALVTACFVDRQGRSCHMIGAFQSSSGPYYGLSHGTAVGICNVQHVCISQCDYTECYARSCMQHDSPY